MKPTTNLFRFKRSHGFVSHFATKNRLTLFLKSGSYNSSKVLSKVCRKESPQPGTRGAPVLVTERASLRVKLRGSLELAGRLRAPAPLTLCDNNPPREGGPASMGIDFASLSGPRHMHPPWNTGGRMSEDDLVRFFRSDLGDTSRDGGACIPLHPSPPAPTPASRRDRACRDLDLPKKLLSRKWLFCDAKSWRTLAPHTTSTTANTTHHSPHHNTRGRGKRRGGREFIFRVLLASKTTVARADLFSPPLFVRRDPPLLSLIIRPP